MKPRGRYRPIQTAERFAPSVKAGTHAERQMNVGGATQAELVAMLTDWELFHYAAIGGTVPAPSRLRSVTLVTIASEEATPELSRRERRQVRLRRVA